MEKAYSVFVFKYDGKENYGSYWACYWKAEGEKIGDRVKYQLGKRKVYDITLVKYFERNGDATGNKLILFTV